jgi:microcystin degradation protein MlrC
MARLAVARLWFCSNSFTPRRTRAEDMMAHEWEAGQAALALPHNPDGELAGVSSFMAQRPGWDVTTLRCASAPAGGPLSAEIFGNWMAEVEESLRRGRFDALYLSLHGACQAEGDPAADLTILRRLRAVIGHTPIVATFDMHANLSEEAAILLDGACGNEIWPSGGGAAAATRALTLLEGILSGKNRPVGALARVPLMLNDFVLLDALAEQWRGPMRALRPPVLDASVFGGFSWGDSPYAGPSALVWADRDAGAAREMAAHLALSLSRWRSRPVPRISTPEAALEQIAASDAAGGRPMLLLDVSDDPVSGGLCDTPGLLRVLLEQRTSERLGGRILFAALHHTETVIAASKVGSGGMIDITPGAHSTKQFGAAVAVRAEIMSVRGSHGAGECAVLRVGVVDILVTTLRPAMITPEFLHGFGITLDGIGVLAVKGGATARAAFASHVRDSIACDCPGPSSPDLLRLPYHYVTASRRKPAPEPNFSTDAAMEPDAGNGGAAGHTEGDERRAGPKPVLAESPLGRSGSLG